MEEMMQGSCKEQLIREEGQRTRVTKESLDFASSVNIRFLFHDELSWSR